MFFSGFYPALFYRHPMSHQIETMDWKKFAQPAWHTPRSVADAVSAVRAATDAERRGAAYDHLRYALGNNHAGLTALYCKRLNRETPVCPAG
jgi:hypothetical protein